MTISGTASETRIEERRDWPRLPSALAVKIHTERAVWHAIAVDLSRSGVQLALVDPKFSFTPKEGDLGLVGLRITSLFGDCFRIEFLEAEMEVDSEMVRINERSDGPDYLAFLGCRFLRDLDDDECGRLEIATHRAPATVPLEAEATPVAVTGPAVIVAAEPVKRRASEIVKARPVRITAGGKMLGIHDLLRLTLEHRATDLHLKAGSPVRVRVDGNLRQIGDRHLSAEDLRGLTRAVLDADQYDRFDECGDLDMAHTLAGVGRFRINVLRTQGDVAMAIRRIPEEVPSIHTLGLSPVCLELADRPRGLVLVTGPTGSGKSTTLAAMIHHVNERRACHIVTMEDPIEYIHREVRAHVTQREIGRDTKDFASALKRAMRQDPDVILVGEMRDLETIAMAVRAAETGHLVLATLHTTSATLTVDRIVDVFPSLQQRQIRMQLADCLQAIISQILVPRKGSGLVVAQELLIANDGIRALIRDGKTPQITNMMQTGGKEGMMTLESSLNDLVARGVITYETAAARANIPASITKPAQRQPAT